MQRALPRALTARATAHPYSSSFCTEGLVQHAPCLPKAQPPPTLPLAALAIMFAQKPCVCSAVRSACAASTARPRVRARARGRGRGRARVRVRVRVTA